MSSSGAGVDAARRFFSLEETQPAISSEQTEAQELLREMVPFTRPVDFPNRHWFSIQRRSRPARSLSGPPVTYRGEASVERVIGYRW